MSTTRRNLWLLSIFLMPSLISVSGMSPVMAEGYSNAQVQGAYYGQHEEAAQGAANEQISGAKTKSQAQAAQGGPSGQATHKPENYQLQNEHQKAPNGPVGNQKVLPDTPQKYANMNQNVNAGTAGQTTAFINHDIYNYDVEFGRGADGGAYSDIMGDTSGGSSGGGGSLGLGGGFFGVGKQGGASSLLNNNVGEALANSNGVVAGLQKQNSPDQGQGKAQANGCANQASRASSAGEDALKTLSFVIEDYVQYLINVANEDAGGGGGAKSPSKSYADVAGMVQKMYKQVYLPLAILFLLPGAVITQLKGLVSFGILSTKDEDTTSPFTGIFRAVIAIFLIPATQLVVSYMIDVGNACEAVVVRHVNMPLILIWVQEQVQIFEAEQQDKPIQNLPNIPMAAYRGKFAGMPIKGAMMEQISGLDAALAELCNEIFHMLTIAMTVMSAFQIVTICYLFLVGPLAAAFFAWPGVGRELFRRGFGSWLDAVVIVSLWKFWWNVILACWTIWLTTSGINPFDPWGVYYLAAWMCILVTVPFNPFEFKPSEIVSHVMMKAESVAGKVAQSGKGGGSGGGGKAKGAKGAG